MERKCQTITSPLKKLAEEHNLKLQIAHIASMFQVFFTSSPVCDYRTVKMADSAKFLTYHAELLSKGIFVPPSQFETCFLSEAHSTLDLEKTINSFSAILRQLN
jgi:glutamate-1-semialdehyde 2,1-aminomutase